MLSKCADLTSISVELMKMALFSFLVLTACLVQPIVTNLVDEVQEELAKILSGYDDILKKMNQPEFDQKEVFLEYKLATVLMEQSFERVFTHKADDADALMAEITKLDIPQATVQHYITDFIKQEVDVSVNANTKFAERTKDDTEKQKFLVKKDAWKSVKEMLIQSYIIAYKLSPGQKITIDEQEFDVPPLNSLTIQSADAA